MSQYRTKVLGLNPLLVRDTMSCMRVEYQHLSPAIGAALCNSQVIPNLYNAIGSHPKFASTIGWPCDSYDQIHTAALVRDMFFQASPNDYVKATENKSLPAFWLNSRRIGVLVGLLERGASRDNFAPLINQWSIASGGSKNGIGQAKIHKFLDLITLAQSECHQYRNAFFPSPNEILPHGLVTQLLLALLWAKANSKSDLIDYYNGLSTIIPGVTNSKFVKSTWIINTYSLDSKKLTEPTASVSKLYCLSKHFQRAVARSATRTESIHKFPSVTSYYRRRCTKSDGKSFDVNDCMEAMIRNFVEHLIVKPETGEFKLSSLPSTVNPIPALQRYFARYTDTSSNGNYRTAAAGQDWFDLVQNLPAPVTYLSYPFELQPGIQNFIAVMNYLFSLNCSNLDELLGALRASPNRYVRVLSRKVDSSYGTIELTFQYPKSHICATLTISSSHAVFSSVSSGTSEPANTSDYIWNQLNASSIETNPHLAANSSLFQRMLAMLYMHLGTVNSKISWIEPAFWVLAAPKHGSLKSALFLSVHAGPGANKIPLIVQDAHESNDPRMLKLIRNCLKFGDETSNQTSRWVINSWGNLQSRQPTWNNDDLIVFSSHPLHEAARLGRLQLCKILIEKRKIPASTLCDGYSVLSFTNDPTMRAYLESAIAQGN